jgi:hypothetical protein
MNCVRHIAKTWADDVVGMASWLGPIISAIGMGIRCVLAQFSEPKPNLLLLLYHMDLEHYKGTPDTKEINTYYHGTLCQVIPVAYGNVIIAKLSEDSIYVCQSLVKTTAYKDFKFCNIPN